MNKHLKHIVYLSIWTLTVVVVWISVLVFQQTSQTELSEEVLQAAEPIDPTFDAAVLNALGERVQVPVDLSAAPPQFEVDEDAVDAQTSEDEIQSP